MRFEWMTPRVPRTWLLLIAAFVWTFAGGMLLTRGFLYLRGFPHFLLLKLAGCILAGFVFFELMFFKISQKHVIRIQSLEIEKPCAFSFFNWRSYLLMFVMITSGITLRKTGIISPEYLAFIYLTMGVPLLMSSFRFYTTFFRVKTGKELN